jgi:hypothetical protein
VNERKLAMFLARWVFQLGDGFLSTPVQRLKFMHGRYPDNEIAGGGICEEALVDQFTNALLAYRERVPGDWEPIETAKPEGSIIGWMPGWQCGSEVHWCGDERSGGWYLANNDPTDSWGPGALALTHWQPLPAAPEVKR